MKTYSLYNGEITLNFNEANHSYWVDDKPIPGVTTILNVISKPALMPWVAKMCGVWLEENMVRLKESSADIPALVKEMKGHYRQTRDKAADTGTLAHAWIENFIRGIDAPLPDDEKVAQSVNAFLEWWNAHEITVLHSEKILFSKTHWYAGTCDLIAMIDGVLTLADFKTSSGIYNEMALQLSGYALAYNEEFNEFPDQRLIIRLPKDKPGCEIKAFPNHVQDNDAWLAARQLHRWQTRMKEQAKNAH